jgi:DNA polymerase (family X)
VLELIQVPGMSMPRVAALHQGLGIATVADLRAAYETGRVRRVKGFGAKTEEKILAGIRQWRFILEKNFAAGER